MTIPARISRWAVLPAAVLIGFCLGGWRVSAAREAKGAAAFLMDADREFDAATARSGLDGWLAYVADDAMILPAGGEAVVGKDAIQKRLEPRFQAEGFSVRWEPVDAYVSGDLGYTYGVSKSTRLGPDGKLVASYGKYLTIWRKQRGGAWKVAVDIGNSSPAPKSKEETPRQ